MREDHVFADLPAAMVEEVIGQTTAVGDFLVESFRAVRRQRDRFRTELERAGLIKHESALGYPPLPTTCATDGSYAIERLLTADLVAAAAVAVEGLTPPSERRHWETPRHVTYVKSEVHHADTATVLRALMLGAELTLATAAPHDLVLIDGTLTLPIIYFNQALNKAPQVLHLDCAAAFNQAAMDYLEAYLKILSAGRSDQQFVGLPKYSTRREIGGRMGWPQNYDDRGMLTLLLRAGELTEPTPLSQPEQEWHLNTGGLPTDHKEQAREIADEIVSRLHGLHVFYYKPHDWTPALRVEAGKGVASNLHRLATVVQGLKHQCATPAMLEPFPLYLADRTVKALARSVPTFRQVTTQRIAERYDGDIGEVFFAMHGYRSEAGN